LSDQKRVLPKSKWKILRWTESHRRQSLFGGEKNEKQFHRSPREASQKVEDGLIARTFGGYVISGLRLDRLEKILRIKNFRDETRCSEGHRSRVLKPRQPALFPQTTVTSPASQARARSPLVATNKNLGYAGEYVCFQENKGSLFINLNPLAMGKFKFCAPKA